MLVTEKSHLIHLLFHSYSDIPLFIVNFTVVDGSTSIFIHKKLSSYLYFKCYSHYSL